MKRRSFLKAVTATAPGIAAFRLPVFGQTPEASTVHRKYTPGNIVNEYTAFLSGEQQALSQKIDVTRIVMQYQTVEASVGGRAKDTKSRRIDSRLEAAGDPSLAQRNAYRRIRETCHLSGRISIR
jgi:hypothetical protein